MKYIQEDDKNVRRRRSSTTLKAFLIEWKPTHHHLTVENSAKLYLFPEMKGTLNYLSNGIPWLQFPKSQRYKEMHNYFKVKLIDLYVFFDTISWHSWHSWHLYEM